MSQSPAPPAVAPTGRRSLIVGFLLGVATVAAILLGWSWYRRSLSAEELLEEAKSALARRNAAAAVDRAQRAVRLSPDLTPAWRLLADAASRNAQPEVALDALEQLARREPTDAGKLGVQLGSYWMKQNLVQPANAALKIAAQANFEAPEPYRLRAQIAAVTGHTREVQRCLVELIRRNAFTRNDLIALASHNPVISDPKRLQEILSAAPENKTPWLAYAQEELNVNRVDAAKERLVMIVESHPDDLEAQALLGQLYADFQPREFLAWHARLPHEAEDDGRIWMARGKWLRRQGHLESAVRCLHEAVLREPELLAATVLLGQILTSLGETDPGREWTERGVRLQRIIDLSSRMKEPRANEWLDVMIKDLEATGRLWEAWAWCTMLEQVVGGRNPTVAAWKDHFARQLDFELPRTKPGSLPGEDFEWSKFPLPDWSRLTSSPHDTPHIAADDASHIRFEDRGEAVGIDFRYVNCYMPERGRKIYEAMGAGVAVLDYDLDGWPDLYFPQGKTWPLDRDDGPSDALYRNQLGDRYVHVTELAGIHETTYSQGVAAGDFDNDGFSDVYVANLGRNRLYRNNGDGTFADVTDEAGLTQHLWTVSCAIADLNGDGLPELFDVNYVQSKDLLTGTCLDDHNRPTVCRPTVYDPAVDTVAINLGDGRFQEQQAEAGLDLPQGMGLGLVIADVNDDNRLDIFVANDQTANYLLINEQSSADQPLRLRDEAHVRGVALDFNGLAQACMGVACADVNDDGRPDFFVTNFAKESNTLYLSQPGGLYQDATQLAGLREPSFDPLGFGTQFLDADHDGRFDLAAVNGHIDEFVNEPFQMKAQFFRGLPNGTFAELFASDAGALFDRLRLGRAMAILDWNRDGRTDFVATDLQGPVLLAENQSQPRGPSLRLKLIGTRGSRDAIGAKVKVFLSSSEVRVYQLTAGDGYESSNERQVEVCPGASRTIDRLEIHWPSGDVSPTQPVPADGEWTVIEGRPAWLRRTLSSEAPSTELP